MNITMMIGEMISRRASRPSSSATRRRLVNNAELHLAFDAVDTVQAELDDVTNLWLVSNGRKDSRFAELHLGTLAAVRKHYAVKDVANAAAQRNCLNEVDAGSFK